MNKKIIVDKVVDENGYEFLIDEKGNRYVAGVTPKVLGIRSGWIEYDSSQGHCGLCGRLACRGTCCR